jgi:hypothetical protein
MHRQISKLNIDHFWRRLQTETDPVMRSHLYFLLQLEQRLLRSEFKHLASAEYRGTRSRRRITVH